MSGPVKLTRKSLAAMAAGRWFEVYGNDGRGYGDDKREILIALRELGSSPNPDDVDEIIGNKSWTSPPECDGCGDESPRSVVRVGHEPDYQSSTAHLCRKCLRAAVQAMESK